MKKVKYAGIAAATLLALSPAATKIVSGDTANVAKASTTEVILNSAKAQGGIFDSLKDGWNSFTNWAENTFNPNKKRNKPQRKQLRKKPKSMPKK